jgi:uncharacterized protein YjbJ (UPF0337 family)
MTDELGGKARHLGGKIREKVGDALGDREMERKGRLDQLEGRAEQDLERAEENLEDAAARKRAAQIEKDGI